MTDTAKCPFCGSDIEPGSQRCGFCGSDLLHNETARTGEEATKQYKCPSCGAPLIFFAENSMLKVTIARYADGYTVRGSFDPRHVKQNLIRTEETKTYIPPAKGAVGGSVRSRGHSFGSSYSTRSTSSGRSTYVKSCRSSGGSSGSRSSGGSFGGRTFTGGGRRF